MSLRNHHARRPNPRWVWPVVVLIGSLIALRWPQPHNDSTAQFQTQSARVLRVVDGDTLLLTDRRRVRLIGADTPETVKPDHPVEAWGPEATQFTKDFCAGGAIRLEFDQQRKDDYGRTLAYVWVGQRMLNEELIRAGLARAEPQYHYDAQRKARFRTAEKEAKSARRGIWSRQGT